LGPRFFNGGFSVLAIIHPLAKAIGQFGDVPAFYLIGGIVLNH
jgi:hypothetical protein